MRGRWWAPLAPPPPPASSGAGHGGSLSSHQRLTPGCCGAAAHLPSQRRGARRRGDRGCPRCKGAAQPPWRAPGRGRGSTTIPVRGPKAVCSPRRVSRPGGTGLLGRSGPGASGAFAKLRLRGPRGLLPAVLRAARSGPRRAPLEGLGVLVGRSQPCALTTQDDSSISGLHEHDGSPGNRGKGVFPHTRHS